jgi:hypothetical protein
MKILKAGAQCILKRTQISRSEIPENEVSESPGDRCSENDYFPGYFSLIISILNRRTPLLIRRIATHPVFL